MIIIKKDIIILYPISHSNYLQISISFRLDFFRLLFELFHFEVVIPLKKFKNFNLKIKTIYSNTSILLKLTRAPNRFVKAFIKKNPMVLQILM